MKSTRSLHLLKFAPDLGHAVPDQPPVGLDLRLARTAKEAETAALAFKVGPASDEAARLIIEMRKLHLQPALGGGGTLSENLEDKSRPVDHFGADLFLEVLLLDRGQGGVHDQEPRPLLLCLFGDLLDLPLAKQCCRPRRPHPKGTSRDDVDSDRAGKAFGFLETSVCRSPRSFPRQLGNSNYRPFPACDFDRAVAVETIQEVSPRLQFRNPVRSRD